MVGCFSHIKFFIPVVNSIIYCSRSKGLCRVCFKLGQYSGKNIGTASFSAYGCGQSLKCLPWICTIENGGVCCDKLSSRETLWLLTSTLQRGLKSVLHGRIIGAPGKVLGTGSLAVPQCTAAYSCWKVICMVTMADMMCNVVSHPSVNLWLNYITFTNFKLELKWAFLQTWPSPL